MKKLLLAATALSLMAAPAFAQSSTITLSGNVKAACSWTGGDNIVNLGELATGVGVPDFTKVNIALGNQDFVCNGAGTKVSIAATPIARTTQLALTGSGSEIFAQQIDYTAALTITGYASGSKTLDDASGGSATETTIGLVNANGALAIKGAKLPSATTTTLVSGAYSGTITVSVTAG